MAKEPKFLWRGVMIAAPVLVLAGLGLYSRKVTPLMCASDSVSGSNSSAVRVKK